MLKACDVVNDRFAVEIKLLITKQLLRYNLFQVELANHIYAMYKRNSLMQFYLDYLEQAHRPRLSEEIVAER